MIDINLIRKNPKTVKESQKKRGLPEEDVNKFVKLDNEWRALKEEVDNLRSKKNKISEEINKVRKEGKDISKLINEAKEIPKKLEDKERLMEALKNNRDELWKEIPNIVDKSVPVGDASKSKILKSFGKIPKFKFKVKDHSDLLEGLGLLNTKKASEVAAARFYFLKGDLVKLNYALINFTIDFMRKRGFTMVQPPFMLRRDVLVGALPFGAFAETIYKIDGEDLYLIGTSEHALNSYHMNEIIDVGEPIRLSGVSSCFRKEAGTHGKDEKGIFRVHQFEKIEQFSFCKPEDSWKEFDWLLNNAIEIFKLLGIPFRTVVLASGDTGRVPTKTIDLEGWFPAQNTYRELGSCSNCLDFQARRSNIKYQDKSELKFVHTLNNTAIATERMIACIVENYQQADGSIKIPKALWEYTGFKDIKPIKAKAEKKAKVKKKISKKITKKK